MTNETKLSEAEVGRRIVAGMSLVRDLFNEVHTLFRLFVEGLNASDINVRVFGIKGFLLPKARKGSVVADRFLKTDMGLIAEIGVDSPDDPDEDVDDIDEGEIENDKVQIAITTDSQFLGVRAILFDPTVAPGSDFSPCVVAVVFSNLTRMPTSKKAKQGEIQSSFRIKRAVLKKLAKQCSPSLVAGNQLSCRLTGAQLSATVASVISRPLASFDSETVVNEFVEKLVELVENA